jgi:hypothetical protein
MSQADFWYIRFPDGRILRAASTIILRQELSAGHIPLGSTVRRSPEDEWVSLEWTQEFADQVERLTARAKQAEKRRRTPVPAAAPRETPNAAPVAVDAATVGSRLDGTRLHLVGVRGYVEELLAALDSTLTAKKLILGVIVGLFLGGLFAAERAWWLAGDERWRMPAWLPIVTAILVLDVIACLLTRLTYVELARLRPARWDEGLAGLGGLTFRVVATQLLIRGATWGLIVLLRWLPYWLAPGADEPWTVGRRIAAGTVLTLGMVLEALLWTVFFLWWLMPSVLVVEECSLWRGLRQWCALLRRHLGRVLLYQMMAVGLGVLVAAPFLVLMVPLFLPTFHPPEELQETAGATRFLLLGLACGPMLTYWIVANMFIYLNLRYGARR